MDSRHAIPSLEQRSTSGTAIRLFCQVMPRQPCSRGGDWIRILALQVEPQSTVPSVSVHSHFELCFDRALQQRRDLSRRASFVTIMPHGATGVPHQSR